MFLIIVPTLNAQTSLPSLLEQCAGRDMIVSDGESIDETLLLALKAQARIVIGGAGRGQQLARAVEWAFQTSSHEWVLILHADSQLQEGWESAVTNHIQNHSNQVGYFTFGANARGWEPRFMEFVVRLRDIWPKLPYGDQGLLISKEMYDAVGGYPEQSLFEDVELIRRLKQKYGRRALRRMSAKIMTDVSAYRRDGFAKRTWRNTQLLFAYNKGEHVEILLQRYKKPAG